LGGLLRIGAVKGPASLDRQGQGPDGTAFHRIDVLVRDALYANGPVGRAPRLCLSYARRVDQGPLLGLFEASLVRRSEETGLELGPTGGPLVSLTFGEVAARSRRVAEALVARGLRAGDRLAVQLPNGLAFLDLFLACLRLGAIFVPVNVLYREREVDHIVKNAEPLAVVTTPEQASLVPTRTRM